MELYTIDDKNANVPVLSSGLLLTNNCINLDARLSSGHLEERLPAGNQERLLQAEAEFLLLLLVLYNEGTRRQEASGLPTLKNKETAASPAAGSLSHENCCWGGRGGEFYAHLFQPLRGNNRDSLGHRAQELDGAANLISHQAVHVGHAFGHAASQTGQSSPPCFVRHACEQHLRGPRTSFSPGHI